MQIHAVLCSLQPPEGETIFKYRVRCTESNLNVHSQRVNLKLLDLWFIKLLLTFFSQRGIFEYSTEGFFEDKKAKEILKYTLACTANWCTDALRLVTLQPIFSCRAPNSPSRDGELLAEQNRKWRSETDKAEQVTSCLLCSLSFCFYLLQIRQVEKLLSWQIQNDISQKKFQI